MEENKSLVWAKALQDMKEFGQQKISIVWSILAVFLALTFLSVSLVSAYKAQKYKRLLQVSKAKIAELEAEKATIEYKITRKMGEKCIQLNKEQIKKLDEKIKDAEKEKSKIYKNIERMGKKELLDAFNQEGI